MEPMSTTHRRFRFDSKPITKQRISSLYLIVRHIPVAAFYRIKV